MCVCVRYFSLHSFFYFVCRREWENGYDNGNSVESSIFHMQTDVWMGNVDAKKKW